MAGTATPPEDASALQHLTQWLDGAGMSWRVVRHRRASSAAAEARALSRPAEMVAKTVLLDVDGSPASIVIPASERLSLAKLRLVLETDDVTLLREDDIVRVAPACELGALPPCGPSVPPVAVVDRRLLTYGHVLCAAGDQATSLSIDPEELVRVTGAREADICLAATP